MADNKKYKIALIMRGMPGSGKSSFVNNILLLSDKKTVAVHAIDDLHVDENGDFSWNEKEKDRLYKVNLLNFEQSCLENKDIVVSDCMNLTKVEVENYINVAKKYGYKYYVIFAEQLTPEESCKQSTHGVWLEKAVELYETIEQWP